ncbi:MAG: ATP-binding cassette domain-containing protein [Betaproteobacteria bacterium]|nr:ATP-binding cassette domain-containing protein [Betaproteobacteria bacterium]
MTTALSAVSVRYPGGATALRNVTVSFAPGEQAAIIGPSGAGKTTLLHTLGCAIRPADGEVTVLGTDPWNLLRNDLHGLRGRLFLAPQAPPLPPRQRVVHAVLAGRLPKWSAWRALRSLVYPVELETARAALGRFRLEDKLFLRCDRLSGGERQRVGLARLIASEAELFLLDEPVSSLDPALAQSALESLQAEAQARGATVVASLHAVDLALARFSRLIGLKDGEILFDLPRAQVGERELVALYGPELCNSFQAPPENQEQALKICRTCL